MFPPHPKRVGRVWTGQWLQVILKTSLMIHCCQHPLGMTRLLILETSRILRHQGPFWVRSGDISFTQDPAQNDYLSLICTLTLWQFSADWIPLLGVTTNTTRSHYQESLPQASKTHCTCASIIWLPRDGIQRTSTP